ncbi:MAG: nicotinate-nicotinamide nucleotide adenylyltransferase [Deltaproteobacteria bacterium]|nr:nicotinate-nicotinamide nucleotide adenylyltransferase [Deltaproteobacteria bacterium]
MTVGILGGTFDPPHLGHLELAITALASGEVREVWFVPCLTHRFAKRPAPFEHRLAMCRLLVAEEAAMKVSDMETRLERPGYSLCLVRALRAEHPELTFRLLAGADIYHERDKWHRYDETAKLAPPLYIARQGVEPIPEPTLKAPARICSSDLRDAFARGERPDDVLQKEVLDYIEAHGLYKEDA